MRMRARNTVLMLSVIVLLQGCRTVSTPADALKTEGQNDLMNAVLWTQSSAEAGALRLQTFLAAREALDRALADPEWTAADEQTGDFAHLPPAVIVDVDETLLDNSPLEARLIANNQTYTDEGWTEWVEERRAVPLPGALEFARYATERSVTMFYVTNRSAEEEAATRDNLLRVGFPLSDVADVVLARGEDGAPSDKTSRRTIVARSHRILLMIGDDLGDFTSRAGSLEERFQRVERYQSRWGTRWFVLPNPMYGSWERVFATGRGKLESLDQGLD